MLRMPTYYTADAEIHEKIQEFVNSRLIELMEEAIDLGGTEKENMESDAVFGEWLADTHFPKNYSPKQARKVFSGLYALLHAKEAYQPTMIMEYLLASLITWRVELFREMGLSTVEHIPDRENIMKAVREEEDPDDLADLEDEDYSMQTIEDLAYYKDTCFEDMDYYFLDDMTEQEIADSPMNAWLGITDGAPWDSFMKEDYWKNRKAA